MGKESIILGIVLILIGVAMFLYEVPITISIGFVVFGIFLIVFWKAEDKIEQRKDIKPKKKNKKK